jgi:hypothetical protein
MAQATRNEREKRMWLEMAASWLRMIKQPAPSAADRFDAAKRNQGTGQTKSDSSH